MYALERYLPTTMRYFYAITKRNMKSELPAPKDHRISSDQRNRRDALRHAVAAARTCA